jgi:DNA-binding MarR family transcriptional regulator
MVNKKYENIAKELATTLLKLKKNSWEADKNKKLRQNEFFVLTILVKRSDAQEKDTKVSDLSVLFGITPAAVTHIVNSLEEKGFLERFADPADRRIVIVRATPKGKEIAKIRYKKIIEKISGLVERLGEKDSNEFIRLLTVANDYWHEEKKSNE